MSCLRGEAETRRMRPRLGSCVADKDVWGTQERGHDDVRALIEAFGCESMPLYQHAQGSSVEEKMLGSSVEVLDE
jgi:hypothetical protein